MLTIGLTGGIASGKSTVAQMIREMGIVVIDADVEARHAVEVGEPAYLEIVKEFGKGILLSNGEINRIMLGDIIFHDDEKRQLLNSIVHPDVRRRMLEKKNRKMELGEKIIVLDIPLLFESQLTSMVDTTLLVYVDEDVQLARLMERNKLSKEAAMARINAQMPLHKKRQLADKVIQNNGSLAETKHQVQALVSCWKNITS